MKRKEDQQNYRKKGTHKQQVIKLTLDNEIAILLQYLKEMPISIRAQFMPALQKLTIDPRINQLLKQKIIVIAAASLTGQPFEQKRNFYLLRMFCKFLGFNQLREYFRQFEEKNKNSEKNIESKKDSQMIRKSLSAFQPNIVLQKKQQFDPIQWTINPNYENIAKMWKLFTDTHVSSDYKYRQLNPNYTFYAQPRFLLKIQEYRQFQSSFPEKGNILMLSFDGSKIIGKKGYAVIKDNMIYWWQKRSKGIKQLINQLKEEKEKETNKQQQQKPAQNQKKEQKQQQKFLQEQIESVSGSNFQLYFKMVGHVSKITCASLSNDQFYMLTAGTDKWIKLWCLRSKTLLAQYLCSLKTIWSVEFSPCGYFFVSGSADKYVKLWSTDESKPRRIYMGHKDDVIKADFMKNPDLIISSSFDCQIRIWNTLTAECMKVFLCSRPIINFTLSTSGRFMMTSDTIGKMSLYDFYEGQLVNSFVVPEKDSEHVDIQNNRNLKIHDFCFSFDEKEFVCVSSKYILIYSFEKLCQKPAKNIYDEKKDNLQKSIATRQVIYAGRDTNLVYCKYQDKGTLVVATSIKAKY